MIKIDKNIKSNLKCETWTVIKKFLIKNIDIKYLILILKKNLNIHLLLYPNMQTFITFKHVHWFKCAFIKLISLAEECEDTSLSSLTWGQDCKHRNIFRVEKIVFYAVACIITIKSFKYLTQNHIGSFLAFYKISIYYWRILRLFNLYIVYHYFISILDIKPDHYVKQLIFRRYEDIVANLPSPGNC